MDSPKIYKWKCNNILTRLIFLSQAYTMDICWLSYVDQRCDPEWHSSANKAPRVDKIMLVKLHFRWYRLFHLR